MSSEEPTCASVRTGQDSRSKITSSLFTGHLRMHGCNREAQYRIYIYLNLTFLESFFTRSACRSRTQDRRDIGSRIGSFTFLSHSPKLPEGGFTMVSADLLSSPAQCASNSVYCFAEMWIRDFFSPYRICVPVATVPSQANSRLPLHVRIIIHKVGPFRAAAASRSLGLSREINNQREWGNLMG